MNKKLITFDELCGVCLYRGVEIAKRQTICTHIDSDSLGTISDEICPVWRNIDMEKEKIVDRKYLRQHRDEIFVFGDNLLQIGHGGAAALRDEPNTYGFITKKYPNNNDNSFYKPDEYTKVFQVELKKLVKKIEENPDKKFLISKLGAGLANRYKIFENVIENGLEKLKSYSNVEFLF